MSTALYIFPWLSMSFTTAAGANVSMLDAGHGCINDVYHRTDLKLEVQGLAVVDPRHAFPQVYLNSQVFSAPESAPRSASILPGYPVSPPFASSSSSRHFTAMPLFGRKKSRSSSSSSSSGGTLDLAELKLGKAVGAGRSGSTFSAHWGGRHVAAKVVDLSAATKTSGERLAQELLKEFRREEEVASALRHPNVVQFLGSASAPPRYCLVFEFMEGGTLAALVRVKQKLPLDFFRLAGDMAQGMSYLHERSVMHRDLKSSNVLLDAQGAAKISDFGLSCVMELGRAADLTAETGTYGWMAPEVIRHEPYSSKADVYSFAVVLWELLARDIPFKGQTPMQTAMAVAEQRMRPALPRNTPPKIVELIEHCWNQDPTRRPDFSAIVQVLPFVKQSLSKTDFKNAGILYTV
ncbi:hypothetical protein PHYPSEUDO_002766 [Phytophthora pseudosyringae]|uniref:Protein kinase domain-containing protein n=1 Tax=Phytophthora pseudosyringae TaxID=221518 RepID=A0A8T1VWH3_9STRA|nr:hypothetical protein PHYPSEUDO_002766 [Phytophthora pseudosyringae]